MLAITIVLNKGKEGWLGYNVCGYRKAVKSIVRSVILMPVNEVLLVVYVASPAELSATKALIHRHECILSIDEAIGYYMVELAAYAVNLFFVPHRLGAS